MSIYALPGSLCELISSGISTKLSKAEAEEACAKKDTAVASNDTKSDVPRSPVSPTDCTATTNNCLLRKLPSDSSLDESSEHQQASLNGSGRNSNVFIAVKEAKIDPERLIRSLSLKPEKKPAAGQNSLGGEDGSSDDSSKGSGNASNGSSSQNRRRNRKNDMSSKGDEVNDSCRKCDPHEDAINFEISVSFNGREYTATRTLPRILQFRYDLIEEFRARRKWRERRRKRKESDVPRMAAVRDHSDDEAEEDAIPELPRLSEDAAGGRGFAMLNALLRPYGPALERWLLKVIDIVPHDSQCLTQFLWEPLAGQAAAATAITSNKKTNKKTYERRNSLSTLGAIEESHDYDSDTDEYLLIH